MEEPPIIVLVSVATQKNGPKAQQDVNTMRVPRQSFRADSGCDQSERSHQQQQQSQQSGCVEKMGKNNKACTKKNTNQ